MKFGDKLRVLIEKKDKINIWDRETDTSKSIAYSQTALARDIGKTNETIQNYLLNKTLPDLETATKIAEIFNVSLDYLFLNELGIDADDYITYEDIDKDTYEKLHSLYKKAAKNTLMYAEAFMDFLLTQNKTSK